MTLDELFQDLAIRVGGPMPGASESSEGPVTGISADSRAIRPGMVFAALRGAKVDGTTFAERAVAAGASAVLVEDTVAIPNVVVPVFRARDPRRVLALAARRLHPQQPPTVVAITGTSGKSSVADFTRQLFTALGHNAASVGTIGVVRADGATYGSLTTPDPVTLHQTLAGLAKEGVTHLAFEASSHGLDQHRLDGVTLSAGAFLNLGRDHLDYHPTVDAYRAAKLRLFTDLLKPGQPAVINADGSDAQPVLAACRARGLRVLTTGRAGADVRLLSVAPARFSQIISVVAEGETHDIALPLVGTYQVENALVAAGLVMATGVSARDVLPHLQKLRGVKGRLDVVGTAAGGLAVVDYAHKPEALEAVLTALRPFATARLVCVFGCGGDRDRGKRPLMGAIATRLADRVIVTDDNPRSESPAAIRADILAAAPGAVEIGDRREAIAEAVASLGPGDVLVVAGKGHETGQIVGDDVLPFSDHEELSIALARRQETAP